MSRLNAVSFAIPFGRSWRNRATGVARRSNEASSWGFGFGAFESGTGSGAVRFEVENEHHDRDSAAERRDNTIRLVATSSGGLPNIDFLAA